MGTNPKTPIITHGGSKPIVICAVWAVHGCRAVGSPLLSLSARLTLLPSHPEPSVRCCRALPDLSASQIAPAELLVCLTNFLRVKNSPADLLESQSHVQCIPHAPCVSCSFTILIMCLYRPDLSALPASDCASTVAFSRTRMPLESFQ